MSNAFSTRVPKYRRHKARGLAVVTLGGRDHYLGDYGSPESQEAYRRLIAEWMLRGDAARTENRAISVAEILIAHLKFAQGYYVKSGKPTNEISMLKRAMGVVRDLYGRLPAEEFGPLALKAVRQQMIDKGWSRNQINKQVDRVKRTFKWAASEELVPGAVYEALRTVSGLRKGRSAARERPPVEPIDDASIALTLARLSPIVADMVRLQRLCGARPGEICDLRPCDVNQSGDVWEYVPESHKVEHHNRQRVIFLGPQAQRVLAPYLDRPAEAYCFSPAEAVALMRAERAMCRKTPLSCGNRAGTNRSPSPKRAPKEKYDARSYGRAIRRAAELAGAPVWSPYRLRHTFATAVRRSHGLEAVQVTLGHSRADVSQIYAKRDLGLAARVAAELG